MSTPTQTPSSTRFVLFPGRHHVLTRFQETWLQAAVSGQAVDQDGRRVDVADDVTVIWAVTSTNHGGTRRNPVPGHRREAAIERFSAAAGLRSLVVPVVDAAPTDRFADITVKTVSVATGLTCTPHDTVVACSTPAVASMYAALGFRIAGVEQDDPSGPDRPWDLVERLLAGDATWRDRAHPATVDVFDRYRLERHIRTVCADPLVGSEGSLTSTRSYGSYARAFEDASDRKWEQVAPHVRPGRVVDVGCATGGLLERAAREPRLHESDLIGIEVSRHLFAECEHKRAQGVFENDHTFFFQRNVLGPDPIFPPRSVDTTLTVALTHEIVSYGDGVADLRRFAARVFEQTAPGGVWVNSDVCGPDDPDRLVRLHLDDSDGVMVDQARTDLDDLTTVAVAEYVSSLSTGARLVQFTHDFRRLSGRQDFGALPGGVEPGGADAPVLRLRDAMEFLTRKDYTDNWLSECHEAFCTLDYAGWVDLVTAAGFTVDVASSASRNDWLVENRLAPVASLRGLDGEVLPWPVTHLLLVARRPEHS